MASVSSTPFLDRALLSIQEEFDSNNSMAVAREARCYRITSIVGIVFSVASVLSGVLLAGPTLQGFAITKLVVPAVAIIVAAISYKAFQCITVVYERALLDMEPRDNHKWMEDVKREVLSFPFFDSVAEFVFKTRLAAQSRT
jgi:hypothetical protein